MNIDNLGTSHTQLFSFSVLVRIFKRLLNILSTTVILMYTPSSSWKEPSRHEFSGTSKVKPLPFRNQLWVTGKISIFTFYKIRAILLLLLVIKIDQVTFIDI